MGDIEKKAACPKCESDDDRNFIFLDESDEEVPVDERWLLSYSDLMTLLFGFFVILYALSLEESHKFDSMVKSIGIGDKQKAGGNGKDINAKEQEDIKDPSLVLEEKVSELTVALETAKFESQNAKEQLSQIEKRYQLQMDKIKEQERQIQELIAKTEIRDQKKREQKAKLQKVSGNVDKMTRQLESEILSKKKIVAENQKFVQKNKQVVAENRQILQKNRQIVAQNQKISQQLQAMTDQNQDLQRRLAEAEEQVKKNKNANASKVSYVSVMIYWTTRDHDIDLSIKTPQGHTFNFKKRTHKGAKGKFVLDTRRGPGAEIWRQEELVPGIYEMKISLYSQYDNPAPAIVGGNISTSEGLLEVKKLSLTKQNRQKIIRFRVKEGEGAKLLP